MTEAERLSRLRHDLSNPLSALLAEIQLLLLEEQRYDPELRKVETFLLPPRSE